MRRLVASRNSRQSYRCKIISSCRLFSSTAYADADGECRQSPKTTQQSNKQHTAHVRSALSSGPLPYEKGWTWQHVMLHRRLNHLRQMEKSSSTTVDNSKHQHHDDNKDCILLFEHEPVYTLGRGASEEHLTFLNNESDGGVDKRRRLNRKYRGKDASRLNIDKQNLHISSENSSLEDEVNHIWEQSLHNNNNSTPPVCAPNGAPVYRIERGGEVTYHGPGQLVMYPLLNLKQHSPPYQQDLHWYLRQIEEVIIQTLAKFNIQSNRDDINTGVWVGMNKIAAVGVSSSRWITTHGLALNVSPNLNHFDKDIITPCGIEERGVTSIANVLGEKGGGGECCCPTVEEVGDVALRCFEDVFNVELIRHVDTDIS